MRTVLVRPFGFYFATATLAVAYSLDARLTWGARVALVAAAWWIPAVHELGHATLALVFRMQVGRCWAVPGFGRTSLTTGGRQLEFGLVALAGPLAGALAGMAVLGFARASGFELLLGEVGQRALASVALAGALESALNLLPVHRLLDGRRAFVAFSRAGRERAARHVPSQPPARQTIPARLPVPTNRTLHACAPRRSTFGRSPVEGAIGFEVSAAT